MLKIRSAILAGALAGPLALGVASVVPVADVPSVAPTKVSQIDTFELMSMVKDLPSEAYDTF